MMTDYITSSYYKMATYGAGMRISCLLLSLGVVGYDTAPFVGGSWRFEVNDTGTGIMVSTPYRRNK